MHWADEEVSTGGADKDGIDRTYSMHGINTDLSQGTLRKPGCIKNENIYKFIVERWVLLLCTGHVTQRRT